jgi:hypothetical protein
MNLKNINKSDTLINILFTAVFLAFISYYINEDLKQKKKNIQNILVFVKFVLFSIILYVFTIGILKDNAWYGSIFSILIYAVIRILNIYNVI